MTAMPTQVVSGADGGGAEFSACGRYRYRLWRRVGPRERCVAFVMLNPSTADAWTNDATIRRCIAFAREWDFGKLEVRNLFAWRSTDPAALWDIDDPVGPYNDLRLEQLAEDAQLIVCAWGAHPLAAPRGQRLRKLLPSSHLHALKLTRDGDPCHPLYQPKHLRPFRFEPRQPGKEAAH